ncbi:hypothetical protein [Actinomyces trachealis]|uniref:hypothetical protein n=1 Tax=Actinomyces trachealis TaxID=2763540 RepID=UPI003CC817E4
MPQGRNERSRRARRMAKVLDEAFGPCYGECVPACPAGITLTAVAAVNREILRAGWLGPSRDD